MAGVWRIWKSTFRQLAVTNEKAQLFKCLTATQYKGQASEKLNGTYAIEKFNCKTIKMPKLVRSNSMT